jgi:four helix bundle protein
MRDHFKLKAFLLADELVVMIYKFTKGFPKEEVYGLTSQMRRAAVSIPSNIVEGCARETNNEYIRFLDISFGSLRELSYQFDLACRLGYGKDEEQLTCKQKIIETEKVLAALLRSQRKPKMYNT